MNGLPVQMLQQLAHGGIRSTADLARKLGVSEPLVAMMAEDLARRGYLAPLGGACDTGCGTCNLASGCHMPAAPKAALLGLTPKGRETAASEPATHT